MKHYEVRRHRRARACTRFSPRCRPPPGPEPRRSRGCARGWGRSGSGSPRPYCARVVPQGAAAPRMRAACGGGRRVRMCAATGGAGGSERACVRRRGAVRAHARRARCDGARMRSARSVRPGGVRACGLLGTSCACAVRSPGPTVCPRWGDAGCHGLLYPPPRVTPPCPQGCDTPLSPPPYHSPTRASPVPPIG